MASSSKMKAEEADTSQEQVFINFRGVELRYNFVSHLEKRLKLNKINAFIDTDEEKGQKLNVLLNRIEDSRIALAIFSPRYTESEWCLKELAKMKERMDQNKLVVIPIFYKVEPYTVKELKGEFGKKFRDLVKFVDKKTKTTWEDALRSIPLIIGFVVDEKSDEYELITKVVDNVKQVLRRLSQESPIPSKDVVGLSPSRGIEHPLKQQEEKLSFGSEETTTRTSGVVGMSGIGTTSIARKLNEKLKNGFLRNEEAPVPTSSAVVAKESTATVANGAPFPFVLVSRKRNKEAPVPTSSAAVAEESTGTVANGAPLPFVLVSINRNEEALVPSSSAAVAKKSAVADDESVVSKDLMVKSVGGFDLDGLLKASAEFLGKGTLGATYKVSFDHGLVVAAKQLKGVVVPEKVFEEKLQILGSLSHVNLVTLIAYHFDCHRELVVFEYMSRGSLSNLLHGKKGSGMSPLNWKTRTRIALGAARAISYLHSRDAATSHGNIKSSNILLSECFEAKVSDYCLKAIISPTNIPNHIDGYSAPEVIGTSKISQKADVYSFGILLFELLTGKSPSNQELHEEGIDLPRWITSSFDMETPASVFDPELTRYKSDDIDDVEIIENMIRLLKMGISCTAQYPDSRPSMSEVTRLIEEISR